MRQIQAAYGGRAHGVPGVTYAMIGINVVMFLITTGSGTGLAFGGSPSAVFQRLALAPTSYGVFDADGDFLHNANGIAQGEYWRLLSSTFLHFGILHILLNMYTLYLLGPVLEQNFGRLRFGVLYLGAGVSGAALSYLLGPSNEQAAGASGAVYGLYGAWFILQRKRDLQLDQITGTIVFGLIISFVVPFIDVRGHIGGLLGGAAIAAVLIYAPRTDKRGLIQAIGISAVLLVVAGIIVLRTYQLTHGSPVSG